MQCRSHPGLSLPPPPYLMLAASSLHLSVRSATSAINHATGPLRATFWKYITPTFTFGATLNGSSCWMMRL